MIGRIPLFDGECNTRNPASTHPITGSFDFFSSNGEMLLLLADSRPWLDTSQFPSI